MLNLIREFQWNMHRVITIVLVKFFAISLILVLVQSNKIPDFQLLFHQKGSKKANETLLIMTYLPCEDKTCTKCEFYTDKGQIKEVLELSNAPKVPISSRDEMNDLLKDCRNPESDIVIEPGTSENIPEDAEAREVTTKKSNWITRISTFGRMPIIFPGTKWCGAGDIAENYEHLGKYHETDSCCRAHDFCNDTLLSGESRNELTNDTPFTKLSCQCDDDFYDCLDRINSVISNTVGHMFFNVLKSECYKEDYPVTKKCTKYKTRLNLLCSEYETIKTGPKAYQWILAKRYKKIPLPRIFKEHRHTIFHSLHS